MNPNFSPLGFKFVDTHVTFRSSLSDSESRPIYEPILSPKAIQIYLRCIQIYPRWRYTNTCWPEARLISAGLRLLRTGSIEYLDKINFASLSVVVFTSAKSFCIIVYDQPFTLLFKLSSTFTASQESKRTNRTFSVKCKYSF